MILQSTFDPVFDAQARDESLMRFAVLNELRLAIGSFAPCEVVMQGCTRVLPLVALSVDHAESTDSDVSEGSIRKAGVSPNRHPQAQSGAANVKVGCWHLQTIPRDDCLILAKSQHLFRGATSRKHNAGESAQVTSFVCCCRFPRVLTFAGAPQVVAPSNRLKLAGMFGGLLG